MKPSDSRDASTLYAVRRTPGPTIDPDQPQREISGLVYCGARKNYAAQEKLYAFVL
jgi:hypothetical protein